MCRKKVSRCDALGTFFFLQRYNVLLMHQKGANSMDKLEKEKPATKSIFSPIDPVKPQPAKVEAPPKKEFKVIDKADYRLAKT
jgi:hypothetical protein